jgi:hypothetical protein
LSCHREVQKEAVTAICGMPIRAEVLRISVA